MMKNAVCGHSRSNIFGKSGVSSVILLNDTSMRLIQYFKQ